MPDRPVRFAVLGDVHGRFTEAAHWLGRAAEAHGPLDFVLAVGDLPSLVSDHGLRPAQDREPNLVLRAVPGREELDALRGRDPSVVAGVAAALDLTDDGDPRAVKVASEVASGAVARWLATVGQP